MFANKILAVVATTVSLVAAATPLTSHAQSSGAPIRFVVGIGPGSGADLMTRYIAERLRTINGQSAVVENKTGGDQVPAVLDVLRATPDGRTLLYVTPTPYLINPLMNAELPYTQKDLRPVVMSSRSFAVLVVNPDSPYKSFKQMIEAAKAKPGSVSMANYGHHYRLGSVALEKLSGAKFNHVSYRGAAQANSDVIANVVDAHITDVAGAAALITSGKLRPLAVTGKERHPMLPDVPTIAELGYPSYNLYVWTGYAVSAKTPDAIVQKLEADLLKLMRTPEFAEFAADKAGAQVSALPGKEFAEVVDADAARILDALK